MGTEPIWGGIMASHAGAQCWQHGMGKGFMGRGLGSPPAPSLAPGAAAGSGRPTLHRGRIVPLRIRCSGSGRFGGLKLGSRTFCLHGFSRSRFSTFRFAAFGHETLLREANISARNYCEPERNTGLGSPFENVVPKDYTVTRFGSSALIMPGRRSP